MSFNRVALFISCLLLALGVAVTGQAQVQKYAVIGGGVELAIGQGLPLPPQVFTPGVNGTVFPQLLVPVASGPPPTVSGTTVMTTRQRLVIPQSIFTTPAAQRTIGLFAQNPTLYAVATNLGWGWPATTGVVMSSLARTGANNTTWTGPVVGGTISYQANPAGKFGGPARFAITHGSGGIVANSPVTVYVNVARPAGNPPCQHPAFGGANPACVAYIMGAWPNTKGAIGGTANSVGTTNPLGNPVPGIGVGWFGATPAGTVIAFAFTPNSNPGLTNMVTSVAYPWTTGMLIVSHPGAAGGGELFTLSGKDNRTPSGAGTIQLVAGALSNRKTSGPNANRGWVQIKLRKINRTPTMSPAGLAATAGLILLAGAYAVRRKLSG
jgi:hypothetical protein